MDMSWTDRQGQVGDLTKHSKQDLQELLLRQEKIISNKRLLQTLPDKGKKIQEFAEKIRQAIKHHEEAEAKERLVSEARMEFQSKYQQAFTMQLRPSGDSAQPECAEMMKEAPEAGLVEAMEKISLTTNTREMHNHLVKTSAKPHYLSVIEKTENISTRKSKFKTNQLPSKDDVSPSGSSSPGQSSEPSSSPLSAQARRERDRKHLDDITAAKLPPLHHAPAQLLSLEESAELVRQQTKKQQELQAKLAAQKLSEGLKISMGSYTPDCGPMAAYREVHDEGAQHSSDED